MTIEQEPGILSETEKEFLEAWFSPAFPLERIPLADLSRDEAGTARTLVEKGILIPGKNKKSARVFALANPEIINSI